MKYMLEVGARTIDDVLAAERGGANRVELYSSPLEGALTPSAGLIKTASEVVNNLLLFVMIRPRAGDFLYSDNEFETMQRDVEIAVEMGADGIMSGILKSDGNLDVERMKDLKRRSGNKKFILHRAFDFSRKPMRTLDEAISLECFNARPLLGRTCPSVPAGSSSEIPVFTKHVAPGSMVVCSVEKRSSPASPWCA